MNKIYKYGFAFLMGAMWCAACSDEEVLEPSHAKDNFFVVPEEADDAVSQLRREFFKDTGVHLLFNDTLYSKYIGKDGYGDDVWEVETVDFKYGLNSYNDYLYHRFELLDENQYRPCADFVKHYVLGKLDKDGSLFPYSVLLLSSLDMRQYDWKPWNLSVTISCMRCLGINVGEVPEMTDEEKDGYAKEVLLALVSSKLNNVEDERLVPFFQRVAQYYNDWGGPLYPDEYWDDWDGDVTRIYQLGFLSYQPDGEDLYYDQFCKQTTDLTDFLEAVIKTPQVDFEERWKDYPAIIERYSVLRAIIVEMGLNL